MKNGAKFEDGTESDQIIKRHACKFREVDRSFYCQYFGFANWYYRGTKFPVLQCIYPDQEGRYPWQPGTSPEFRARQPVPSSRLAAMPAPLVSSRYAAMQLDLTTNEEAR